MNQPLIPTPIVDKNGRQTTVHKRARGRIKELTKLPEPEIAKVNPAVEEFLDFMGEIDSKRKAAQLIPEVDPEVLVSVLRFVKDKHVWEMPVHRVTNLMLMGFSDSEYIEMRLRHALVACPIISEEGTPDWGETPLHILQRAGSVHGSWANGTNGIEYETHAKGSAILSAIVPDHDGILRNFTKEDAFRIGENSDRLFQLLPQLQQRVIKSPADVEPFLESTSLSLSEGAL